MSHPVYGLNELREMFLRFFESKGHLRLPSFSLIPQNDKSILLINAGMTPMKPWFKGEEEPPRRRVCTCQKCIRTGDIDNVGHTARHGTFFEMLGNFSFGDYFKHEAIAWSWEFLTSPEWVGLEPDRLYPSVFAGSETTPADDEAFAIWRDVIGIPENRIFRFGKEDNFWEHGSGPCGPCSEIYYDRGEQYGCGKPGCTVGCDCDRYVEVWNIVFSQFNNDGHGNYTELKQKNIDTGMGLERLACVCQNVASLFDVDTVMNITNKVSEITGAHYEESDKTDVSLRVNETDSPDAFEVRGRGELHLSILIEQMRRQDYEFAVSRPKVIYHKAPDGTLLEPIEELTIDVPQDYVGAVMEKLGRRKAEMIDMISEPNGTSVRLLFHIPTRGLLGYRNELLTDTRGNGVMSSIFYEYEPYKGDIEERTHGSLVCSETGETNSYGLFNTQDRGRMFVGPGVPVYMGEIVGECSRNEDIVVNVCKKKHVTNMRAAGSDDALRLTPHSVLSLEQCLEFIADDELVEVTPKNIRMRKRILSKEQRMKIAAREIRE